MRLQSSLGRIQYLPERTDLEMAGYLTIAKVLKVHHKRGTADVQIIHTGDTVTSHEHHEGIYAVPIMQTMSGHSEKRGKAWGTITPLTEGSYVILTFLDKMKKRPILIGQLPSLQPERNVYPEFYPLRESVAGHDRQEAWKQLTVFPSQAYTRVDGESNVEWVHANKSFFAMFRDGHYDVMDTEDHHLALDRSNLSEDFESDLLEAQTPAKLLYVHRTSFDDGQTTWTKFFLDDEGTLRITRDNRDEQLTYLELQEDGAFRVRRQLDSPLHGEGENYSELQQAADGALGFTRVQGERSASVGVTATGEVNLTHSSGAQIALDENLYLEAGPGGKVYSESLQQFVAEHHMVVTDEEPQNPHQNLIWIDTSS
ncbi:hypothetical protein IC620_09495 [Hazenella sp. IB182357]|uniref:Uncharacterized protein n=1 Tax=Polycladospora coralii TaxID=2771432 RepID=A0A926RUH9_9BACL|nr:hypothetical protein [Polycladospora coralii]MBD1372587.1 hypothetical protein [Polycladospora coralii]